MTVYKELLDDLTEKAKVSSRLRMNFDMRTTPADTSQRMLNALEPGTEVPIHRHPQSTETVALLRGSIRLIFYNEQGQQTSSFIIEAGSPCPFYLVPQGEWHTVECLSSGTILFEAKDGAYKSMAAEDVMQRNSSC